MGDLLSAWEIETLKVFFVRYYMCPFKLYIAGMEKLEGGDYFKYCRSHNEARFDY
jgi:hypothetical protein